MCENKIEKHSFSKARGAEETPSLSRSRLSLSRFPSSTEDSLVLCAETWRGERLGYVPGERERRTRIERSLPYWSRSASLYSLERRCTSLLQSTKNVKQQAHSGPFQQTPSSSQGAHRRLSAQEERESPAPRLLFWEAEKRRRGRGGPVRRLSSRAGAVAEAMSRASTGMLSVLEMTTIGDDRRIFAVNKKILS